MKNFNKLKVYFLEEMGFQLTLKGIDVGILS